MKRQLIIGFLLFMISCKPTSIDCSFTGKWKYSEYLCGYTLELGSDSSFTYARRFGCGVSTYEGHWSYLNNHTIFLSFSPIEGDPILQALSPRSPGKEMKVEIIDSRLLKLDSLSNNAVLVRVGK